MSFFEFTEEEIIVNKRQKRLLVVPDDYQIERGSGFREVDEKDLLKLGYVKQSDSEDLRAEHVFLQKQPEYEEIQKLRDLLKKAEERNLRQLEKLAMAEEVIRDLRLEIKSMLAKDQRVPFL